MGRGIFMAPVPQPAGVGVVLVFPVPGVLGTTVTLAPVWLPGDTVALTTMDDAIESADK